MPCHCQDCFHEYLLLVLALFSFSFQVLSGNHDDGQMMALLPLPATTCNMAKEARETCSCMDLIFCGMVRCRAVLISQVTHHLTSFTNQGLCNVLWGVVRWVLLRVVWWGYL